jgi:DnaJ-class molecular chaperone
MTTEKWKRCGTCGGMGSLPNYPYSDYVCGDCEGEGGWWEEVEIEEEDPPADFEQQLFYARSFLPFWAPIGTAPEGDLWDNPH